MPSSPPIMRLLRLLLLQSITTAAASRTCRCTPTKYYFRLSLSNDCSTNDVADNTGIKESLCFVESNVPIPAGDKVVKRVDRSGGPFGSSRRNATSTTTSTVGENDEEVRSLQAAAIEEVVSIQFLEFDTSNSLNVIYTDDSYISTSMGDGEQFSFYSSSALNEEDMDVGGVSLILYGKSGDGSVVTRNRFFWLYDGCEGGLTGVEVGDEIGWVTVDAIAGPYPKNCPAVPEDSPTIAPRTEEPAPTAEPGGNVDWVTPFPTPSGGQDDTDDKASGTDDKASGTDDEASGTDDKASGTDDTFFGGTDDKVSGTDDTAGSINDDVDQSDDLDAGSDDSNTDDNYGPPSSIGTKTNKPYHKPEGYIDVAPGGKTHKHPYDNLSYDGGLVPEGGKSAKAFGKSGKNGKAFGKSLKASGSIDEVEEDDDYHATRLFSESVHNGENVR